MRNQANGFGGDNATTNDLRLRFPIHGLLLLIFHFVCPLSVFHLVESGDQVHNAPIAKVEGCEEGNTHKEQVLPETHTTREVPIRDAIHQNDEPGHDIPYVHPDSRFTLNALGVMYSSPMLLCRIRLHEAGPDLAFIRMICAPQDEIK